METWSDAPMSTATRPRPADALKDWAVPNLQRGLAILEYLASERHDASITQLSAQLKISTASVFRITGALVELGYLAREPQTKRYSLTNKFLRLGQPRSRDESLAGCALDALRAIRQQTRETTQLCCLIDTEMVIIDQLLALHPFKYSADLGARCPAYSCAPGKAIVAFLPTDEQEALLEQLRFKKFTETTITSKRALRDELARSRDCGYAIDRAEGMPGIHCVAAPILDHHGRAVGAITIAGPANRVPESEFSEIGQSIIRGAQQTAERFNR